MEVPSFREIASEVTRDFKSERLVPGFTTGLVIGLIQVIVAISFAALIYSGELSTFVGFGIGFALIGAIITGVFVPLVSSLRGTVSGIQDAPAAILALMSIAIAASMPVNATVVDKFATVSVAIALTTLVCGIFLLSLGFFNLGGLVRFLPYPVVGGFLAGSGWLLVIGSLGMMTDVSPSLKNLPILFQPEVLIRWLPGLTFAIILMWSLKRFQHYLSLVGLVLAAVALFYLVMSLAGFSFLELGDQDWLLGPFPEGSLFQSLPITALVQANWTLVLAQVGNMVIILIISAFALLLNISSLELVAEKDMQVNHELRVAGLSNILTGLFAGLIGFHQLSMSAMNIKTGAQSRLTGIFSAGVCLVALAAGTSFVAIFPKVILGGLLLFLGLTFLYEWAYETWFKLPKADYFIILMILVVIAIVGFLEGVVVGIIAAVILFAINYSRVEVVKHALTAATYQSRIDRPKLHKRILNRYGKQVLILELQGYIFFGTANHLLEQIRAHIKSYASKGLCFLLLDFSHVTGIDSSVVLNFRKMSQLVKVNQVTVIMTGMSAEIHSFLSKSGVFDSDEESYQIMPDLDQGVEWCESQLLDSTGVTNRTKSKSFQDQLAGMIGDDEVTCRIMNYLEKEVLPAGVHLIHYGDAPGAMYFIEQGMVTAVLEDEDEQMRRLNTMGSENLVGEIGFYLGSKRNASVITETQSTLYRLTTEALKKMESEQPEAAALFHKYIANVMAEKLSHLMATVETLRR